MPAAAATEKLEDFLGVGVLDLDELRLQGRELLELTVGFELLALALGDLCGGRDHQHITGLALVQALGFQNQAERLIPRHVLEAQGDTTGHRIACHQVQVGEVSDKLQHRTHLDVLEVEREFFSGELEILFLALYFLLGERLDRNHVGVVCLVGEIVVLTTHLDPDFRLRTALIDLDGLYRSREIHHVIAPLQFCRDTCLEEGHIDRAALEPHVNVGTGITQREFDPPFAVLTAAEVEISDAVTCGYGCSGDGGGAGLEIVLRSTAAHSDHEFIAFNR